MIYGNLKMYCLEKVNSSLLFYVNDIFQAAMSCYEKYRCKIIKSNKHEVKGLKKREL